MSEPAAEPNFEGHENRYCGEHRTVGPHRAWCHDCSEWCYPKAACLGCECPQLCAEVDRLRADLADAQRERDALAQLIAAGLDLHPRFEFVDGVRCDVCVEDWPCQTVLALTGLSAGGGDPAGGDGDEM